MRDVTNKDLKNLTEETRLIHGNDIEKDRVPKSFSRLIKDAYRGWREGSQRTEEDEEIVFPSRSNTRGLTLWAKAREKLPDLHLMESEREDEKKLDFGSSIKEHMELKLWVCVVAIVVYLAVGSISYSYVFESWSIVDSLYFSMVTFTTVGYGDLYPSTGAGQLFTAVYSLTGISFWGLAIAEIGSRFVAYETRLMLHTEKILNDIVTDSVLSLTSTNLREDSESGRKKVQMKDSSNQANFDAILTWIKTYCFVFISLLIGSLFIGYMEGWGVKKSIYFCTMTATTVGYGDFVPSSARMRLFAVAYIPLLVGVMTYMLGTLATLIWDIKRRWLMKEINHRQLHVKDLSDIDSDGDGNVSEMDFVAFLLWKMQKVDKELLDELRNHFRHFDVDNDGLISKSDLYQLFLSNLKRTNRKLQLVEYKQRLRLISSGRNHQTVYFASNENQ